MFDRLYCSITIRAVRKLEGINDTDHYRSYPGNSAVPAVRFDRKYSVYMLSPTIA